MVSRDVLSIIFALFVLAGVVLSFGRTRIRPTPPALLVAGSLSGFFGTLTSIGAPPLALVYQGETGPRIRGTLSANIVIGVLISLIALNWNDRFGGGEMGRTLALLPAGLLGLAVAQLANMRIDQARLKPLLLGVTGASAAVVLMRSLL